jgi:hypothetical protein
MAVKIIANYSKRLGLPGYSSHQFSVSVETELPHTGDIQNEAAALYHTLQSAVDREIQSTGFVPNHEYGTQAPKALPEQADSARANTPSNGSARNGSPVVPARSVFSTPWKASDKQRDLIQKLVEANNVDIESVEALSEEMFGSAELAGLNKIEASGLIDELLTRYGKKTRGANPARFNGRSFK